MLSKNQIKLVRSLHQKKNRNKHQLFIVEGEKSVKEFLNSSFELHTLFHTEAVFTVESTHYQLVNQKELSKISALKNPNHVLAVFKIPKINATNSTGLIVALDAVQDPGNLGTIIRLCDWFGVQSIICSTDTVDCYNPKVVQASMGSLTRIPINYIDLSEFLTNTTTPIYVSLMEGVNIYKTQLPKEAILVMGNEANGISDGIMSLATHQISIPKFGNLQQTESLNVATATAILLSEFRR